MKDDQFYDYTIYQLLSIYKFAAGLALDNCKIKLIKILR